MSLIFIQTGECKNISVEYPDEVNIGEVFSFEIELTDFSDGDYDIKIDINENDRIASILNNGKWQTTYRFVTNAIKSGDNDAELKLNVTKDYEGEAEIVIKIRKSGASSTDSFSGYKIEVSKKQEEIVEDENDNEEGDVDEENVNVDNENIDDTEETDTENNATEITYINNSNNFELENPIYLNKKESQTLKAEDNSSFRAEYYNKIKLYSIYIFILCLIAALLIKIKSKKKENVV